MGIRGGTCTLADSGGLTEPRFGMYKCYHANIFTPGRRAGFFSCLPIYPGLWHIKVEHPGSNMRVYAVTPLDIVEKRGYIGTRFASFMHAAPIFRAAFFICATVLPGRQKTCPLPLPKSIYA
jgi:hypothetical protein